MRMETYVIFRSRVEDSLSLSAAALEALTPPSMMISAERGRSRMGEQVTVKSGTVNGFYQRIAIRQRETGNRKRDETEATNPREGGTGLPGSAVRCPGYW